MVSIDLIRHGDPTWAPNGVCVDDPELSDRGMEQAAELSVKLSEQPIDVMYVSHLARASQTARIIADRKGIEPVQAWWLAELGHPTLVGKSPGEVDEFFDDLNSRDLGAWWDGPPGGESFPKFDARVRSGIESSLKRHSFQIEKQSNHTLWHGPADDLHLVFVAHAGTTGVLISYLLDVDSAPWIYDRFRLPTGGIARLQLSPISDGAIWSLCGFGSLSQLA